MFGGKLRSWMEAVRPRKKQHRKDKPAKGNNVSVPGSESKSVSKLARSDNAIILSNDFKVSCLYIFLSIKKKKNKQVYREIS